MDGKAVRKGCCWTALGNTRAGGLLAGNPASPPDLTLSVSQAGSASRSVERMKKWPKKAETQRPLEQRMRMTASQAVGRVRLWHSSTCSFWPSRGALNPG